MLMEQRIDFSDGIWIYRTRLGENISREYVLGCSLVETHFLKINDISEFAIIFSEAIISLFLKTAFSRILYVNLVLLQKKNTAFCYLRIESSWQT